MKDGKFEKGEFRQIKGAYQEFANNAVERRQLKKGVKHLVQQLIEKHPDAPLDEVYPHFLGLLREQAMQNSGAVPTLVKKRYEMAMLARVGKGRLESFNRIAQQLSKTYRPILLEQISNILSSSRTMSEKENEVMQKGRETITLLKDRLKHDPALLNGFRGNESLLDEVISDWALAQREDLQEFIREKREKT